MAGRPRLFDKTEALRAAMGVFWRLGFNGASMADLEEATGVGRQSLYNAIGSKEVIFTRALEMYGEEEMEPMVTALQGPGSPLERVRAALVASRESLTQDGCRGCLMIQTIAEVGGTEGPLASLVRSRIQLFESLYHGVLEEARRAGELAPDTDTRRLTRLLMASSAGMALLARAEVPDAFLDDILQAALERLL